MEIKNHKIAVDANNIIHRLYHATKDARVTPDAFFDFVKSVRLKYGGLEAVLCFDSELSWRKQIYPGYKENREEKPADLVSCIFEIFEKSKANYDTRIKQGYEAEDAILQVVTEQIDAGFGCCIVSSDKDLCQLIDDEKQIFIFHPIDKVEIFSTECFSKHGVWPHQIVDFLSLVGDTADEIKGCPGIGKVTAIELLSTFGSIQKIYEDIDTNQDTLIKAAIKQRLVDGRAGVRDSFKVVKLRMPKEETKNVEEVEKVDEKPKITIKQAALEIMRAGSELEIEDLWLGEEGVVIKTKNYAVPLSIDFNIFKKYAELALRKKIDSTLFFAEVPDGYLVSVVKLTTEEKIKSLIIKNIFNEDDVLGLDGIQLERPEFYKNKFSGLIIEAFKALQNK